MQLTSNERIFVVTDYLKNRSLKEVQQLFEQRFRDIVSPTKITIWKITKIDGLSLNPNKDRSGRRRTERVAGNH